MAGLLNWRRERSASLFDRIRGRQADSSRHTYGGDLLASIKKNLIQVLNTHPGASYSAPLLGVIDLNDATASATDFRQSIVEAIRTCIIDYEPRIARVAVSVGRSAEQDPLTLSFHILAQVDFDDIEHVVEFNIHLDNHQRYHLS